MPGKKSVSMQRIVKLFKTGVKMQEFFKKENKIILFLLGFFLFNLYFFFLKQGSLTTDVGREFYIPWQMLKGEVLYKDILNIYGPLAYQINSLAYIVFGQKILTLYSLGVINSFVVLICVYLISREFLDKVFSSLITCFTLYACVFETGLFNLNMPYSFAMIYGLSSFLLAVLFLIKYSKEEKPLYCYLSCLFSGFALSCKYEYILFPFLILFVILFLKPLNKKDIFKSLCALVCFPIISYGALFLQGVNSEDIKNAILLLKKMSQTGSIKYLYTYYSGTYFNLKVFYNVIKDFSYLAGVFFILFSFETLRKRANTKSKEYSYCAFFILLTFLSILLFKLYNGFGFLPVFLFSCFLLFFKFIIKEPSEFILYASGIIISLKTFFALNLSVYGVFTLPLVLIGVIVFLIVTLNRIRTSESVNNAIRTSLIFLLGAFVVYFAFVDFSSLDHKPAVLKTEKGNIYGGKETVSTYNQLIDFVDNNTEKTDKVVMLPETPWINFFTGRDSDNYYHSLIPLYVETFGEKNIIEHFKKTKPEYIIINNRDTSDYGYRYMCLDYAVGFCSYIKENYSSAKIIEGKYNAIVYRRKDLK